MIEEDRGIIPNWFLNLHEHGQSLRRLGSWRCVHILVEMSKDALGTQLLLDTGIALLPPPQLSW
jgi:hypothetical protein